MRSRDEVGSPSVRLFVVWRVVGLAVLACLAGCQSANIATVDASSARDLGEASDSSAADDASEPALDMRSLDPPDTAPDELLDARGSTVDDGSVDAGPERPLLFWEDFSSTPLASAAPRWTVVNSGPESWRWDGEALRSGPGPSCVYWGNRLTEPDDPFCDEGPALIHSPSWEVGNGRFTIELDIYAASADDGHRSILLFLHRETEEPPRWEVNPEGTPVWPNRDSMLEARVVLSGPRVADAPHVSYCSATARGIGCMSTDVPSLVPRVWYRWRIETCDDQLRLSVVERDTGIGALDFRAPLDVAARPHYERVYLLLGAEDTDKAFDDVQVWSGCTGDP